MAPVNKDAVNLENFASAYVCLECSGLLYRLPSTPRQESCLTLGCSQRDHRIAEVLAVSLGTQPILEAETEERESKIVAQLKKWKRGKLATRTWAARRDISLQMFDSGQMTSIGRFHDLEELLILLNRHPHVSSGYLDSTSQFESLLDLVHEWADGLRWVESLEHKRFALINFEGMRVAVAMSYENAIQELYATLGYVQRKPSESTRLFPYQTVEQVVSETFERRQTGGWGDAIAPLWPLILSLRYVLETSHRGALQHHYQPDASDMSVIFGWYQTTVELGTNGIVPAKDTVVQTGQYQQQFDELGLTKSGNEFIAKYVTNLQLVPIIVSSDLGWHLDRPTILLYLLYLHSQLERDTTVLEYRGRGLLDEAKDLAAIEFENWLRKELTSRGFECLEMPLKLPGKRHTKFEYDIVALSEIRGLIVIAEAKYRDPPPSSLTGDNLVTQELAGADGLATHARTQQERLEYFKDHLVAGTTGLNPQNPLYTYVIENFVVTKHIPLVHQYRETTIVRAFEFLERFSAS